MNSITVHSPASVANIVCGFDILGMALSDPYDVMTLSLRQDGEIRIKHTDNFNLPVDPARNVVGAALQAMQLELEPGIGFDVIVEKQIMPGSGLGSSAAGSAGAVVAANKLLREPFNNHDLVRFAMAGEKLASGVKHADNIAPCIYGGITLIRSIFPLDIVPVTPPSLYVTAVHPQIEVKTSDARQILRKEVQLKDAIRQWGNIAGLVAGLLKGDYALIGRSLEDVIIEPVRSVLIPGFDKIKQECKAQGALGGGISGSGPSIFMLSEDQNTALRVSRIMQDVYHDLQIDQRTYVTTINTEGVKVISSN